MNFLGLKIKDNKVVKEERVPDNVVELIHNDFDNAGEELLDHAKELLVEETEKEKDKVYGKLSRMGFTNVPEIESHTKMKNARIAAKNVASTLEAVRKRYPKYKIITREQTRDICKKYGLVLGRTKWFISEIPDKNKLEIVEFELHEDDKGQEVDFMIVATKEDFDMDSYELDLNDWELKELPKDPIVLVGIGKLFIVVSKWGKEEDLDELR